jgi:hypothetical protein
MGEALPSIRDIQWESAEHINDGGYGVIFRVAPGFVAKVADSVDRITSEEVEAQRYFALRGEALPVYDYAQSLSLPLYIRRCCCSVHGVRGIAPCTCTCASFVDALLMPEATITHDFSGLVIAFIERIGRECRSALGYSWEGKYANIGRYQGHLVALDFGPAITHSFSWEHSE